MPRIRISETPPTAADINRIVFVRGTTPEDEWKFSSFLRRMRSACFLPTKLETEPTTELESPLSPQKRLIAQYAKDGLALFLGAGVSCESGIPNWPQLSRALLLETEVSPEELPSVKRALPAYVAQFELAGQMLRTKARFVSRVYRALYGGLNCKPQLESIPISYEEQKNWSGWSSVVRELSANQTLAAVGDLLLTGSDSELRRNPQIHAVLTSNLDNLLEIYCLAKSQGKRLLTWIDRASVGEHPNETPIYHLHGFLDARRTNAFEKDIRLTQDSGFQEITDDLLPDLILRESDYYQSIASPVSFVNHTPQSFFRRLNVLFIGTALEDLNMRRWLHDSFRERVEHRTKFLRELYRNRYEEAEYEAIITSRRHFWLRPKTEADKADPEKGWDVPQEYVQKVMSSLGVQVVWCDGFSGMRDCLKAIHATGEVKDFGRQPAPYRS